MPLTKKGEKILTALVRQYPGRGKEVLYAGKNKGTFTGIDDAGEETILDAVLALSDAVDELKMRSDAHLARRLDGFLRSDDRRVIGGVGSGMVAVMNPSANNR